MIDSKYRRQYQLLVVNPLLKKKWLLKQTPLTFTLIGLILGIAAAILISLSHSFLALLCLILSGIFDTLDGSLARKLERSSDHGAALDIMSDRIVEFAIILGLFFVSPEDRGFICITMLGSILICITSFLVVGIFTENESVKSFHYSPGLIERTEAFAFFALMIFLPQFFVPLGTLFSLLVAFTGFVRIWQFSTRAS